MHVLRCEACEPQCHDAGQASEPVRRRRGGLVLAHGGDHEHRQGRYGDRDVREHGPGVGVRPVQVFEHQETGAPVPDEAEEARDRLAEHEPGVDPGLRRGAGDLGPVREQPCQRRAVGAERRRRDLEAGTEGPDEGVGDGSVGATTLDRAAGQDDMRGRGLPGHLLDESRLADAGLSTDEHDAPAPGGGLDERVAQDCELLAASDKRSATGGHTLHDDTLAPSVVEVRGAPATSLETSGVGEGGFEARPWTASHLNHRNTRRADRGRPHTSTTDRARPRVGAAGIEPATTCL